MRKKLKEKKDYYLNYINKILKERIIKEVLRVRYKVEKIVRVIEVEVELELRRLKIVRV